jgi:hypothetical protein
LGAFVDVIATDAVALVASVAVAGERTNGIGAGGDLVTVIGIISTFVDVVTIVTRWVLVESCVADTSEGSGRVGASGGSGARMSARGALIDVVARQTDSLGVAGVRLASEGTDCVGASALGTADLALRALVNVLARHAVTCVTGIAIATERTEVVDALSISMAVVYVERAFVHVVTGGATAGKSSIARAGERTMSVGARGVRTAVICITVAFVDVDARHTVSRVTGIAITSERAHRIRASGLGVDVAVVR